MDVASIRRALAAHPSTPVRERLSRSAAVAMVMCQGNAGLETLLIRRAEQPLDLWSGHVAFPGGRALPGEPSVDTAVRETAEEVGLDLRHRAELLGGLDEVQAVGRGRAMDLLIRPWVFALPEPPPPLTTSHEVASAHWIPLQDLLDPARQAPFRYVHEGTELVLPSIRVAGLTVWGLTYLMIMNFQAVMGASQR